MSRDKQARIEQPLWVGLGIHRWLIEQGLLHLGGIELTIDHIPNGFASEPNAPRTPLEQLRLLLIRLSEHWASYRVFDWQQDVPWTNNGTERGIGRMKMRSRTVRGYKSEPTMLAGLMAAGAWVY